VGGGGGGSHYWGRRRVSERGDKAVPKWQSKVTRANELQVAFHHFGYEMTLLADLRCNAPTLAAWERARTNLDAAYVVMVTGHWVAIRGKWFCDIFTHGVPVRIKDAPRRRKWVQSVYQITVGR
jgi:hypothetical protein